MLPPSAVRKPAARRLWLPLSAPAASRSRPPPSRASPEPRSLPDQVSRSIGVRAIRRLDALQLLPLRRLRRSTQLRVARSAGTMSCTTASSHQTMRPPFWVNCLVKTVSEPPDRPNSVSKRKPRRRTSASSSSRLLVAATCTGVPVGSRRLSKKPTIQGSGSPSNSETTGPTTEQP